jgi:hypothetical protein
MLQTVSFLALGLAFVAPAPAEPARSDHDINPHPLARTMGRLIGTWESPIATGASSHRGTKMSFRWAADQEVILWEGSYAAEEATWSFAAVFFFDRIKDRVRVFAFNSNGQRHLGMLQDSEPVKLVFRLSGLLPDGRKETFVMEFVGPEEDTLVLNLRDRRPNDGAGDSDSSVKLRRAANSG